MKADNLTLCKRCGSDAAYKQEVTDEITNYSCFGFLQQLIYPLEEWFLQTVQIEEIGSGPQLKQLR